MAHDKIETTWRNDKVWLFAATLAASLGAAFAPLLIHGFTEMGFQLAARYTVRVSFPLFLLTYLARPLAHTWRHEGTLWLLKNRRYLGLSFAIAHSVHLAALSAFFIFIETWPDTATMIGGGLAYVAMFAMALTSNNVSVKKLGANWHRLHLFGMHYLWLIFAITYLGRWLGSSSDAEGQDLTLAGMVGTLLCLAALTFRVFVSWRQRTLRQRQS